MKLEQPDERWGKIGVHMEWLRHYFYYMYNIPGIDLLVSKDSFTPETYSWFKHSTDKISNGIGIQLMLNWAHYLLDDDSQRFKRFGDLSANEKIWDRPGEPIDFVGAMIGGTVLSDVHKPMVKLIYEGLTGLVFKHEFVTPAAQKSFAYYAQSDLDNKGTELIKMNFDLFRLNIFGPGEHEQIISRQIFNFITNLFAADSNLILVPFFNGDLDGRQLYVDTTINYSSELLRLQFDLIAESLTAIANSRIPNYTKSLCWKTLIRYTLGSVMKLKPDADQLNAKQIQLIQDQKHYDFYVTLFANGAGPKPSPYDVDAEELTNILDKLTKPASTRGVPKKNLLKRAHSHDNDQSQVDDDAMEIEGTTHKKQSRVSTRSKKRARSNDHQQQFDDSEIEDEDEDAMDVEGQDNRKQTRKQTRASNRPAKRARKEF
jgi:hypothetical protein